MKQTINLNDLEIVKFNGLDVENLKLNGTTIWEKGKASDVFNYTGLDANGNMEGQLAFDGTIVAYAIGKPTITITTAEDGTQSESITYAMCNGYNNEYYNYNFNKAFAQTSISPATYVSENDRIISEDLVIPSNYNGKPVTKIIDCAFSRKDGEGNSSEYYQNCFIKTITLGNNITDIGSNAFNGIGFYPTDANTMVYVFESENIKNSNVKSIGDYAFCYVRNGGYSFDLPTNLNALGCKPFFAASKVRVNSNIMSDISTGFNTNYLFTNSGDIIFSSNVTYVTLGKFNSDQNALVFEQDVNTEVTLNVTSMKSATAITIYTDNNSVKNFDWATNNYTVTFKSLSEYTGS